MFQFPPCPPTGLCVQPVVTEYCSAGFPHSGASGSPFDDNSPELIAAIRALLRLLAPRHPPHALSSLIHVRRQHLNRVTSYSSSAQLLRCHPAHGWPTDSRRWRLPPNLPPGSTPPATATSLPVNNKTARPPRQAPRPTTPDGPEWTRTTDPCVISTVL